LRSALRRPSCTAERRSGLFDAAVADPFMAILVDHTTEKGYWVRYG
jgi:hypothetical protein